MSHLRKTKNITITAPIPSVLSPNSVKTALQNHPFMLDLSPIVTSHTPIDASSSDAQIPAEPDFVTAQWYRVSETVPLIGNINFLAAFKNTSTGQESLVQAPAGLRMHVRYFVESAHESVNAAGAGPEDVKPTALRDEGHGREQLNAPDVSITPATPIMSTDTDNSSPAFNDNISSGAKQGDASTDARPNDWAFLGSQGHGYVLREECTLQANMFLMPFITFNFESVHRRMQARLFEMLASGEGPIESS